MLFGRGSLTCDDEDEEGEEEGSGEPAQCTLRPRDLLQLGPRARREGAAYTLEAQERLVALVFSRESESA